MLAMSFCKSSWVPLASCEDNAIFVVKDVPVHTDCQYTQI